MKNNYHHLILYNIKKVQSIKKNYIRKSNSTSNYIGKKILIWSKEKQ